MSAGKTDDGLVFITLLKLSAFVLAFAPDCGKVTSEFNIKLPSRIPERVQLVAPVALESTALLKSAFCWSPKVATVSFGSEAEKVTAQQLLELNEVEDVEGLLQ